MHFRPFVIFQPTPLSFQAQFWGLEVTRTRSLMHSGRSLWRGIPLTFILLPLAKRFVFVISICQILISFQRIFILIDAFPSTDNIIAELHEFVDELNIPPTSGIHPPYCSHSIFEIVQPILASIATFPDTAQGHVLLADRLQFPVADVTQPLQVVFNPPIGSGIPKLTPADVANAVTQYLIQPIQSYVGTLSDLIRNFGNLVHLFTAVSAVMLAVKRDIELFAQSMPGASTSTTKIVTAQEAADAWTAVGPAANGFISLVASGSVSGGLSTLSASAISKVVRAQLAIQPKAKVFNSKQLFRAGAGNKSVAASVKAVAAAVPPITITQADVTKDFGAPPAYSAQTLPEMSATTGKIEADFQKIMTMPFIEYVPCLLLRSNSLILRLVSSK